VNAPSPLRTTSTSTTTTETALAKRRRLSNYDVPRFFDDPAFSRLLTSGTYSRFFVSFATDDDDDATNLSCFVFVFWHFCLLRLCRLFALFCMFFPKVISTSNVSAPFFDIFGFGAVRLLVYYYYY
jgi:hypothetical protein